MPKHGQRQRDVPGRNNPTKSQEISTGTYKKQETYKEQAAQHEDPGKAPPHTKVPQADEREGLTLEADSRAQTMLPHKRSGSDSNARSGRKDAGRHAHTDNQPQSHVDRDEAADYAEDLNPSYLAGEHHGMTEAHVRIQMRSAADIKRLHNQLGDFTNDELRAISVMPDGARLEQGAVYLDLLHRERGEFTAMADMVAAKGHYYVPKKDTDYVTWNRLLGVTNPARLDEA